MNTTPQVTPLSEPVRKLADEFLAALHQGIAAWENAGKILVQLVDLDANIFRKLIQLQPWLDGDVLTSFYRIGKGKLYPPMLLLPNCPAFDRICTAPIETQIAACSAPIEVVESVGKEGPRVMKVWAKELNRNQAEIVIRNGVIRSVEDQVATIKARNIVPAPKKVWNGITTTPEKPGLNPVLSQTVLQSFGCFVVGFDGGTPFLVKRDGPPPANAQNIICKLDSSNTLGAVINFQKWGLK